MPKAGSVVADAADLTSTYETVARVLAIVGLVSTQVVTAFAALIPKLDLGSVPDWVAGALTAVAVAVPLVALVRESRLRRRDDALRDEERRDMEIAQARGVMTSHAQLVGGNKETGIVRLKTTVSNHSTQPIIDVIGSINFHQPGDAAAGWSATSVETIAVIEPGQAAELFYEPLEPPPWPPGQPTHVFPYQLFAPMVGFTDAAGRRWSRVWNAQPSRVFDDARLPSYLSSWLKAGARPSRTDAGRANEPANGTTRDGTEPAEESP